MDKIYWSTTGDPLDFPRNKSYYLPFAEKIARMKYGWYFIKAYLWIRTKLDGTL
jgi:hypothetical protein